MACSNLYSYINPREGQTKEEMDFSVSDVVVRGLLINAKTSAQKAGELNRLRQYEYLVLESFKGGFLAGDKISVEQMSTYCSHVMLLEREYLLFLNKGESGTYGFGLPDSRLLMEMLLNMRRPEDVEYFEQLVALGLDKDYEVRSTFPDGSPKVYFLTIEKQLEKYRNIRSQLEPK